MNEITETVASIMISTRPAWLLPFVVGFAITGVLAAAAVCFAIGAAVAATVKRQGGGR